MEQEQVAQPPQPAPAPEREALAAEADQLRAELAIVSEDLRRSREHLTLFAGQVSHDLRSPLTAVLANAEMLAAEPEVVGSPDLGWMVDGVRRAAGRMTTMIDELVAYAEQGGRPTKTPTSLGSVCARVLEDLAPQVEATGAKVEVGTLPTLPADATQLYAVVLNLVSNALHFTRPGTPPEVRVGAQRRDPFWRVCVEDRGIGIEPGRHDEMFVLFARADKRVGGSGIGLAAVKRIVEAHGGRVGMESTPGEGTTVWFELPA